MKAETFTCHVCDGGTKKTTCGYCEAGTITIDPAAIVAALTVTRGYTTGHMRRSRPADVGEGGVTGAIFIWRMVRFHAGLDLNIPALAALTLGFPTGELEQFLNRLVDAVGAHFFGPLKMLSATARWGALLTGDRTLADALGVEGDGSDVGDLDVSPEYHFDAPDELTSSPEPVEVWA